MEENNLMSYESDYIEERRDTDLDYKKSQMYDNNEISVKKSFIIFGIVVAAMLTIFILNALEVIPWWGTLISSVLVLLIIVGFRGYFRSKNS